MTRNTQQKEAIRKAFTEADRPLSPEEALQEAQILRRGISIATVYRSLKLLVEDGWLKTVELPGEATRYELASKDHHHHFHCKKCGKLYELESCPAPAKPKLSRGFRVTGHEFFLYGSCPTCSSTRVQADK